MQHVTCHIAYTQLWDRNPCAVMLSAQPKQSCTFLVTFGFR